jgi:Rrf2 family protein
LILMPLLPRKGILAIAAVIDVALHGRSGPVSARALATRHGLPPRHLEPVLQALVRDGILRGVRGPRGGYEMAREHRQVTVEDILRAAGTVDYGEDVPFSSSPLVGQVVRPAIAEAERAFSAALAEINIEDMARGAEALVKKGGGGSAFSCAI